MRSKLGLSAAVAFLLALPLAALIDATSAADAEATLHLVWALGFALLARAWFTFGTPQWVTWLGSVSAGALALIFVLQGVSNLLANETLHRIAFPVLGAIPERVLVDLLVASFVGLLLTDSRGGTKVFGWLAMSLVVGTEGLSYATQMQGGSLYTSVPALKLVLLLPFVWLLCESLTKSPRTH